MGPWANAVAFTGQKPYYSRHLPTCLISAWIGGNIRLITRYGTLSEWVHTYDIANAVACTGRLPTNVSLFTSPTNVSDIGLNRGKYLSHFQVGNAVRMIHIAAWVHGLMLSHSQARNPTIHVTYQRVWNPPTNVSDIGLNGGWYLSHFQVGNAVRMIHIAAWVHGLMLSHS